MPVDNPLHQSSLALGPTDLSDFVNMDLFTTQGSTSSDSREPSPSISTPLFSPLPVISEPNPSDWFNFSLEEDFVKSDHSTPPPITGGPWDFLTLSNDIPDSRSANTGSGLTPSFAIDPQLMSSSVPHDSAHDLGEVKEDVAETPREEEDEEDEIITSLPVKAGGKGKSRKGIVQSGGIQKKATISAVVRDKDDPRDDGDDWRPSPEEYKKMSSKEKRQLRNKISARNFRVRRKGEIITAFLVISVAKKPPLEYITTLEGDIAERDRLIDHIRTELGSSQSENVALRQEIGALKKALLASAGRAESPALPPPGPIPVPAPRATGSSLVTPNTQKDLPSSPRVAASASKAFWGGSASFGGVTPVHTTLIPENFAQPLASVKSLAGARTYGSILQENINPLLKSGNGSLPGNALAGLSKAAPFDSYADANPLSMKMLDA
jgi:bZIP-type transcription factor MBZ1